MSRVPARLMPFVAIGLVCSVLPAVAAPLRTSATDYARRIDVNQIVMPVSNTGLLGIELGGESFTTYPKGSGSTALVSLGTGLWISAQKNAVLLGALADYRWPEFGPGRILPNGSPDNPNLPAHVVYKVVRWTGNPADSAHVARSPAELAADPTLDPLLHHAWSEYMSGAAPYGAPVRLYRLPVTGTPEPGDSVDVPGPDVLGDQMLWCVFNDADPALHLNTQAGTSPLGLEVRQAVYAFDRPGALGNAVFVRYTLINRSAFDWVNTFVSQWSNPMIGEIQHSMLAGDAARQTMIGYDTDGRDPGHGTTAPAIAYVQLEGPLSNGARLPANAFISRTAGTSTFGIAETWYVMRGLDGSGGDVIDPSTGLPTKVQHAGDPLLGTGWNDTVPGLREALITSGPFTLAAGDSQQVTYAIVSAMDSLNLSSFAAARCAVDQVRSAFLSGFSPTSPPVQCPFVEVNCPGTRAYWAQELAAGSTPSHTNAQLTAIAGQVDLETEVFEWGPAAAFGQLHTTLLDQSTARARAKAEYAAMLTNLAVRRLGYPRNNGGIRYLNPLSGLSCEALSATDLEQLLAPADLFPRLYKGEYLNLGTQHPTALMGVGGPGGTVFGNGGAVARSFYNAGALHPVGQADSFVTVEIRFSPLIIQKAYRYLRYETAGGGAPAGGRRYAYGGHRLVRFTVWDVTNGQQLDAGFVERAITDGAGTLLPPESQVATFDSTWAPEAAFPGGREYLVVFKRPYSSTPKAELAVDGLPTSATSPAMYNLWSQLVDPYAVIDHGDKFVFTFGVEAGTSFDQNFFVYEPQPLSDPNVVAAYDAIAACLGGFNAGVNVGTVCGTPPGVDVPETVATFGRTLELAPPEPNPARHALGVAFVLPRAGPARLALVDVAGRRVLERELGPLTAGRHALVLPLDPRFRAGVYFLRLVHGDRTATRKLVVVR